MHFECPLRPTKSGFAVDFFATERAGTLSGN